MSENTNQLDAVIAEYLQAVERGEVPNRQDLLDHHPALADELRAFFAQLDHVDQLAAPLRLDPTGDQPPCPAPPDRIRYFGDYELLEEIARGGMGIVYKARQTSLNRIVALKMILKGTFATPRDTARFRAEAESAANLDHPNIVPIHEVGEYDGHQYYTMRFIEGRPLNQTPRANPRNEAEQIVTIARAVHYAHQRGILHRDLKPSNILISFSRERQASADSTPALAWRSRLNETPFVVDFGLAKRLDANQSLTESGQIIGTPRYMAPEQAAGRRDLTIAADVYSLGVILYERLTGRTPFMGDDPLTIMRQVRETEPPRPSTITPGVDPDLQTVVLKCLEKEPAKRYASAAELADDLERWLRGEPILARPVGQMERFRRWCRHNPAVAGLTGAVAAALVVGTVISTGFAMVAERRRERAQLAEIAERQARDELEGEFVRSLFKPLDPEGHACRALNDAENEALWTLAELKNEALRSRFLKETSRDPFALRQVHARSECALVASLGLDAKRRDAAASTLGTLLGDRQVPNSHRVYLASLAAELESEPGERLRECARIIKTAGTMSQEWQEHWRIAAHRLEPIFVAEQLAEMLVLDKDASSHGGLVGRSRNRYVDGMPNVAPRLDPDAAARIAQQLAEALARERVAVVRWRLVEGLRAVAARLDPDAAAPIAQQLAEALLQDPDSNTSYRLANALSAVAARLDPGVRASIAQQLAEALVQVPGFGTRGRLARVLSAVAPRLDPAAALPIAQQLGETLVQDTNERAGSELSEAISAVAPRLDPAAAEPIAQRLAETLVQDPGSTSRRKQLAEALSAVTARLDLAVAARICATPAQQLAEALAREKDVDARRLIATGLSAVGGQLDPTAAAGIAQQLANALIRETSAHARRDLAEGLSAVAARLDATASARICAKPAQQLAVALTLEKDRVARWRLAQGLSAVAARLDHADAAPIAQQLAEALTLEKDRDARWRLAQGLSDVASRLDGAAAARICVEPAQQLAEALTRETSAYTRRYLADGLSAVAARLDPAAAARICAEPAQQLAEAMAREKDADARWELAKGLSAVAADLHDSSVAPLASVVVARLEMSGASEERFDAVDHPLRVILSWEGHAQRTGRACAVTAATTLTSNFSLTGLPFLLAAAEPLPCRLTTQELVELLKMPTCFGPARRVILDQLENRYKRRFCNHWAFVRYAQENGLNLDFTTPPKRPSRTLTWPEEAGSGDVDRGGSYR